MEISSSTTPKAIRRAEAMIEKLFISKFGLIASVALFLGESKAEIPSSELMKRETLSMGSGCNIALQYPANLKLRLLKGDAPSLVAGAIFIAPLPNGWKSHQDNLSITLFCAEKNLADNPQPAGTYDEATQRWRKNVPELRKYLMQSQDYSDPELLEEALAAIRVHDVKTPNAHGWADTSDQLTGDEAGRTRYMSFCIYHGAKVLCGLGKIGLLRDGPKGNLMPHALQILRSIEFLD